MTTYRVTIPVVFTVEINDDNENVSENKTLCGDTPRAAERRALKCLLAKEVNRLAEQKTLGIKRVMTTRPSVERKDAPPIIGDSVI
jgi:hypothetical protein